MRANTTTRMNIKNFEELEKYLENWVNFHGEGGYDANGALHLLAAILRNMQKNAHESDFDDLKDVLSKPEQTILRVLSHKLSAE
jgi:hypothetical protein